MKILTIITLATSDACSFMHQFPEATLTNENDTDIFVWICRDITDKDAATIQNSHMAIGSHFIDLASINPQARTINEMR